MSLDTDAGRLTVVRAAITDYDEVMAMLREAADWLSARGIHQWYHWYMDAGERHIPPASVGSLPASVRLFARSPRA
jgi:hypothetical protein